MRDVKTVPLRHLTGPLTGARHRPSKRVVGVVHSGVTKGLTHTAQIDALLLVERAWRRNRTGEVRGRGGERSERMFGGLPDSQWLCPTGWLSILLTERAPSGRVEDIMKPMRNDPTSAAIAVAMGVATVIGSTVGAVLVGALITAWSRPFSAVT
jgi:hypothetical protein